jgi:glutamate/tyrosine decarboxylase-like PLP-dependent enzyme
MDPADLSIELSRPFRGLRLWLPLKVFGVAPFRAALEEKLLLANYFYHHMKEVEGFELCSPPDLSIVPFRYIPKRGDANEYNRKLINLIQCDGRIFISSTILNGNFTLRVAILGFRTHLATINLAMEVIREKVEELNKV